MLQQNERIFSPYITTSLLMTALIVTARAFHQKHASILRPVCSSSPEHMLRVGLD